MRSYASVLALLLVACGPESPGLQAPGDLVREAASQMRDKTRVHISVRASAEEPTPEDLEARRRLEERIEQENIGRLVSVEAGAGHYGVVVEVDNTADTIPRIQEILRSMGLARQASFKVIPAPRS